MVTAKIKEICSNCGSTFILEDEDGKPYCFICGRPCNQSNKWQDYGRMGGLQTYLRHGREHMVALGKRGGRPRLRQLPAPEVKSELKGGNRLPNSIKELKELVKSKYGGSQS